MRARGFGRLPARQVVSSLLRIRSAPVAGVPLREVFPRRARLKPARRDSGTLQELGAVDENTNTIAFHGIDRAEEPDVRRNLANLGSSMMHRRRFRDGALPVERGADARLRCDFLGCLAPLELSTESFLEEVLGVARVGNLIFLRLLQEHM